MNEQVLQLFRQAGGTVSIIEHETGCEILTYTDHFDPEKFAESIIRECADYITEYYDSRDEAYYMKKHFGIE